MLARRLLKVLGHTKRLGKLRPDGNGQKRFLGMPSFLRKLQAERQDTGNGNWDKN